MRQPRLRSPQVERLLWGGWALIALKTVFLFWVVAKYHMPFSAWWVVLPTVIFAAICTGVYCFRGH